MDNVNCTVHHAYLQADRFVFLQTQASKSLKDVLLSYAMSDPALLHSVLAHSAQHLATLTPNETSTDMLYHKSQAISLLNTRIRDQALQSAIGTTFCAVACMTHLEVSFQPLIIFPCFGFDG
jgi:Fungal specific transcription factor domain